MAWVNLNKETIVPQWDYSHKQLLVTLCTKGRFVSVIALSIVCTKGCFCNSQIWIYEIQEQKGKLVLTLSEHGYLNC